MTGCIPAGGQIELSFQLTATELGSFESWFKLKLKEGKTINIRITGSVELPRVYINRVCVHVTCTKPQIHVHVYLFFNLN